MTLTSSGAQPYLLTTPLPINSATGTLSAWIPSINPSSGTALMGSYDGSPLSYTTFSIRLNIGQSGPNPAFGIIAGPIFPSGQGIDLNYTLPSGFRHFMVAWDFNHPAGSRIVVVYVDDVQISLSNTVFDAGAGFSINYAADVAFATCGFPGSAPPTPTSSACWWNLWIYPGVFLDLTVVANRRKFISAGGHPVDLGANGELPTGSSPPIFQTMTATSVNVTDFFVNHGTAGGMSALGPSWTLGSWIP
jgi:hypothetical protein